MNFKRFLPGSRRKIIYVIALSGLIITNLFFLKKDISRILTLKKALPYQMIGYQFAGLEEFTKDIKYIGYYTDRNILTDEKASKMFAHAQYILAPSILDLNNTNHSFILFVCSDEKLARQKIKEIKAIPLRRNKFGMILARRLP